MNKVVDTYKKNSEICLLNYDTINKNIMKKKNIDDILNYLLDKSTCDNIKKFVANFELLYKDRTMASDKKYCDVIINFTQPQMRKIHSIMKIYGSTFNTFLNINKELTYECHGEDSYNFMMSTLNTVNILFNKNKKLDKLCPICPACDDMHLKLLYKHIFFTLIIILSLSLLILMALFDVSIKYKY